MIVIERQIQKIYPDKWAELDELDKKYNVLEQKYGFPPKKRFTSISGSHDNNTLIIEREWKSFAVAEATYEKAFADPEYQKLGMEAASVMKSARMEFYTPRP